MENSTEYRESPQEILKRLQKEMDELLENKNYEGDSFFENNEKVIIELAEKLAPVLPDRSHTHLYGNHLALRLRFEELVGEGGSPQDFLMKMRVFSVLDQ